MHRFLRSISVFATLALTLSCGVTQQQPALPTVTPAPAADTAASSCDNLTPLPESQMPAGFDYPQTSTTVSGWVSARSGNRQRLHAWCVFAGLNQGWPAPTWRKWGTSTDAFPYQYNPWLGTDASGNATALRLAAHQAPINQKRSKGGDTVGGNDAIVNPAPVYGVNQAIVDNPSYKQCLQPIPGTSLYSLKDGENFQSNGDILIAAVSYNQAALNNIKSSGLANAVTLNGLLPAQASSPSTSISAFPSTAMVLKVMLWPVDGGGSTWTAVTALPVWDWDANPPGSAADGQYAGYEMQQFWTRAVAISSGPVSGSTNPQRVQFLYGVLDPTGTKSIGPNTYNNGMVVGLDRFYSKKYSDADLAALSNCDRAIIDASSYWTFNRAFRAGDSLALVAMHIMTKEQSDWTFQSAWWHPDALACSGGGRYCGDRPASVPGGDTRWQNYMITTTYGQTQQASNPNSYKPASTVGPVWPVAYNPYIELAASHPITTNCMNCHHRAAWPPLASQNKPDMGRTSSYLQASPVNPNALESFVTSNSIFNGLTTVDSMWAVSDRAGYPTTTPKQ
jgi:hypothetical protein